MARKKLQQADADERDPDLENLPGPAEDPHRAAMARVAEGFKSWRPAREVLVKVRAVPTIFPQYDRATRCYGHPIERVTIIHGPSGHGKTLFTHGLGLSFLRRGHFYGNVDAEYCYDEQTEVLTRRGFVPWPEVQDADLLGCWDPGADSLVYERPLEVTRQDYDGTMYRVDHAGVDLLVTPAHKMYVQTVTDVGRARGDRLVGWTDWRMVRADELGDRTYVRYCKHAARRVVNDIDLSLTPVGFPPHDDSRALLRLIGFFVGDGWVGAERGRTNGIAFTLKKARKVAFLKEVCLEVGWPLEAMANDTYVVRAQGVGRLFRDQFYDDAEKCIPEWLLDLNVDDAAALLDGLRASDGTSKRGAWEYSTASKNVASAVQRLVLHAGGAAHIHGAPPLYRVMVLSRMLEPVVNRNGRRATSWEEYKGRIYCAHTRTGLLVVRRNGKPVVSGNTTPSDWLQSLMAEYADHPGFVAIRPETYEQTVDAVRSLVLTLAKARTDGELREDTSALVVVDSLRKLVPEDFWDKIHKHGAGGKKGSVDGMGGRGAQIKAKMNADWLDELTPLLARTGTAFVGIARESEDVNADQRAKMGGWDWKMTGGKAIEFDSSLLIRITRGAWVTDPPGGGEDSRIVGERHKVTIRKTKVSGKDDRNIVCAFHTSNGVLVPAGFDTARDLLELAKGYGIVEAAGSWLKWGAQKWQGESAAVRKLTADAALLARLDEAVRARFRPEEDVFETEPEGD